MGRTTFLILLIILIIDSNCPRSQNVYKSGNDASI